MIFCALILVTQYFITEMKINFVLVGMSNYENIFSMVTDVYKRRVKQIRYNICRSEHTVVVVQQGELPAIISIDCYTSQMCFVILFKNISSESGRRLYKFIKINTRRKL